MIRWQLNKLEHTRLLSDKNLATLSAEINLYDPLTSQYNWSGLLKVAIDKLVEVGKEHAEVFNGQVPVALREPYLKRQGVVLKFDYDGRGHIYWICYAPNIPTRQQHRWKLIRKDPMKMKDPKKKDPRKKWKQRKV